MVPFKHLAVNDAKKLIESCTDISIVDIRSTDAFMSGHINKAINVSNQNIEEFIANTNKDKPLICYCYHGYSSQRAASFFIEKGFKEVYSLDGGYTEWENTYGA